jgi:hypothetical protein
MSPATPIIATTHAHISPAGEMSSPNPMQRGPLRRFAVQEPEARPEASPAGYGHTPPMQQPQFASRTSALQSERSPVVQYATPLAPPSMSQGFQRNSQMSAQHAAGLHSSYVSSGNFHENRYEVSPLSPREHTLKPTMGGHSPNELDLRSPGDLSARDTFLSGASHVDRVETTTQLNNHGMKSQRNHFPATTLQLVRNNPVGVPVVSVTLGLGAGRQRGFSGKPGI